MARMFLAVGLFMRHMEGALIFLVERIGSILSIIDL